MYIYIFMYIAWHLLHLSSSFARSLSFSSGSVLSNTAIFPKEERRKREISNESTRSLSQMCVISKLTDSLCVSLALNLGSFVQSVLNVRTCVWEFASHTRTRTHTYTHIERRTHNKARFDTLVLQSYTQTRAHTNTHTHTHAFAYTLAHTHTHTHTHEHTHTHPDRKSVV